MCSMRKLMLRRVSTDCQLRSVWLWMPATPSSRKAWSYMAGESDREPPEPTQQARKRGADTGGGAVACSRCIFRRQRQQLLAGARCGGNVGCSRMSGALQGGTLPRTPRDRTRNRSPTDPVLPFLA